MGPRAVRCHPRDVEAVDMSHLAPAVPPVIDFFKPRKPGPSPHDKRKPGYAWYSCGTKFPYPTEDDARDRAHQLRLDGARVHAYRCEQDDSHWHVGRIRPENRYEGARFWLEWECELTDREIGCLARENYGGGKQRLLVVKRRFLSVLRRQGRVSRKQIRHNHHSVRKL